MSSDRFLLWEWRQQLHVLKQTDAESVAVFAPRTIKLVLHAFPELPAKLQEYLALIKFTTGLRDVSSREYIRCERSRRELELEEAVHVAQAFELLRVAEKTPTPSNSQSLNPVDVHRPAVPKARLTVPPVVAAVLRPSECSSPSACTVLKPKLSAYRLHDPHDARRLATPESQQATLQIVNSQLLVAVNTQSMRDDMPVIPYDVKLPAEPEPAPAPEPELNTEPVPVPEPAPEPKQAAIQVVDPEFRVAESQSPPPAPAPVAEPEPESVPLPVPESEPAPVPQQAATRGVDSEPRFIESQSTLFTASSDAIFQNEVAELRTQHVVEQQLRNRCANPHRQHRRH